MFHFDYNSIEFPPDVDYEELLKYLLENPEKVEQTIDTFLQNDKKWIQNEKYLNDLREKRKKLIENIAEIEKRNEDFDELLKKINEIDVNNKKCETISDIIYYDKNHIYYPQPIQRIVDINELIKRMKNTSIHSKHGIQSTSKLIQNSSLEKGTQTGNASEGKKSSNEKNVNSSEDEKPSIAENIKSSEIKMPLNEGNINSSEDQKCSVAENVDFSDCDVVYDGLNQVPEVKSKPFVLNYDRTRHILKVGDEVFAASNGILTHSWKKAIIAKKRDIRYFSVRFCDKSIIGGTLLPHKLIAYNTIPDVTLSIGERVIAYLSENIGINSNQSTKELYSGTIAEPPKHTNDYRYLIFFDKNVFRYVKKEEIHVIYERSSAEHIFEEKDKINDSVKEYADFLRRYIKNYPERPMLRLQKDDKIRVRFRDKWELARVSEIDSSLALIHFDKLERLHSEWIYRGSVRLLDIHRECNLTKNNIKGRSGRSTTRICRRLDQRSNKSFVEWNNDDINDDENIEPKGVEDFIKEDYSRKKKIRQTARKSTAKPSGSSSSCDPLHMIDNELDDSVEVPVDTMPQFEKNLRPFVPHECGHQCVSDTKENQSFYNENPYHIPMIVGYRRELFRYSNEKPNRVVYRGPCGRRLRSIYEVFKYLSDTESTLDIDLFTFSTQFLMFRKSNPLKARFFVKDISNGQERQPISCVNTVDNSDLGNVVYSNIRFPHKDVVFNPNPDFLSCCDCTDNCANAELCSCQQLTIETSDAVRRYKSNEQPGYDYKRLDDFVMTGTFECNNKCPCNERCVNRVVQNGIKCRLQLFKTLKKGWGVRVLHDVPKGAFLCIYAAQILNEEVADKEGKHFGDEYLADLDYIDVCEQHKEGYESDVEDDDEDYDDSDSDFQEDDDDEVDEDYKFNGYKKHRNLSSDLNETSLQNSNIVYGGRKRNEDKSKIRYSIREDFFNEDFCYILDAKKCGNIGRYLNHSCEPNCFVQNVFVDTHDLRFPWVSFFAKKDILAYEELTWDYNYQIGSIPGRKMLCYCGAHRCKKRLL